MLTIATGKEVAPPASMLAAPKPNLPDASLFVIGG
jgi:hypothetical protein